MVADPLLENLSLNESNVVANTNRVPLKAVSSGNDNAPGQAVLSPKKVSAHINQFSSKLIQYHSPQRPVLIEVWGTPEYVYDKIRLGLIAYGYEVDVAEKTALELVEYAEAEAEEHRQKSNVKIIALKLEVSKSKPSAQLETGAMFVTRIDGKSGEAQVAGAASVAVGLNTGGTFTTALRDSVSEILESFELMGKALYIVHEHPNKSELQGVVNEVSIAAIADLAAGNLSPSEIADLMERLDMMVEAELLAPEFANALKDLNAIQKAGSEGNLDAIQALTQSLFESLEAALGNDAVPNGLVQAMIEATQLLSDKYGLQGVMNMADFNQLKQAVLMAVVTEKLESIVGALDGVDQETLQALIDEMAELEGAELHAHLDKINETLSDLGIVLPEISDLQNLIVQNMPLSQRVEFLLTMQAEQLMDLIAELGGIENLPPELAELLEGLDIDNLTIDDLKEALKGNGDPALVEAVQNFIDQIQNPEIQALLPEGMADRVAQFVGVNAQLNEALATQSLVTEMSAILAGMDDPNATTAIEIVDAIERLEAGESLDSIDPAILESVMTKMEGVNRDIVDKLIQNTEVKSEGLRLAAEIQTNPELFDNPDLLSKITDIQNAGPDEISKAVNSLKIAVDIAQNGDAPVVGKPAFDIGVVQQQLTDIVASIPTASAAGKVASRFVESINNTVTAFKEGPPPTLNKVIKLAEDAQALIKNNAISDRIKSQITAIDQKVRDALSPNQRETLESKIQSLKERVGVCPAGKGFAGAAGAGAAIGGDNSNSVVFNNDGTVTIAQKSGGAKITLTEADITSQLQYGAKEAAEVAVKLKTHQDQNQQAALDAILAADQTADPKSSLRAGFGDSGADISLDSIGSGAPASSSNFDNISFDAIGQGNGLDASNPSTETIGPVNISGYKEQVARMTIQKFDFKESLANSVGLSQKANVIKQAASNQLNNVWNNVVGGPCDVCRSGCKACGSAFEKVSATAAKSFSRMGEFLGVKSKEPTMSMRDLNLNKT